MKNLKELTSQEAGIIIIIYNGQGALYNWGSAYELPHTFPPNLIGCSEEVPEVKGKHMDISHILKNININTDKELPKFGTVYQVGDITVIAPDDWA